jgi:uncharacterized protein (TIGR00269 family)
MKYYKSEIETFELEIKPFPFPCKLCKKENAVIEIPSQKIKVCKNCYNTFFENRVKKAIETYKMLRAHDKIGVFLSGGKDSAALLCVLKKIFPEMAIQAVHINLGIRYYSEIAEETVRKLCEKLNVPLYVYNLPEKEGYRIDDFIFTHFKDKICSVCGTIKRYLFSKIAKELGINVIATGHHLDDTVSTMLNLFFQGDFSSIIKLEPVLKPLYPGQARKIKPFYTTPEKEIFYYVVLNNLPVEEVNCPHGEITPSKKKKKLLEELEKENRQIKYQLLSVFYKKLIPLIKTHPDYKEELSLPVSNCIKCGEITSSADKICSRCKRIDLLNKIEDRNLEVSSEEFFKFIESTEPEERAIYCISEEKPVEFPEEFVLISPTLLSASKRKFIKTFRPYKAKTLFLLSASPRVSYLFVLKLRKLGFKAFNIKDPEKVLKSLN